jgi:hypothetical protein
MATPLALLSTRRGIACSGIRVKSRTIPVQLATVSRMDAANAAVQLINKNRQK